MIKVRLSKTAFVFLIFLTVAELFQAGVISGWHLTAVMISVFIFACGLLLLIKNGSVNQSCEVKPAIFVVSQWLVFILYNFVLYLVGVGETIFMKSSMIQVTLPFFILSGGWGFYYIFKNNALRYFRYSIFINFLLVIVIEFFQLGPLAFLKGIASVFSGLSVENPLEKSFDAVFAIGLYFIYMFNMKNFENKPTKRSVIFLAFFMAKEVNVCLWLA